MTMNFKDFAKRFPKTLEKGIKELQSKKNLDKLGTELVKEIQVRTQLGKGVDKSEGKAQKLKAIKPATKTARKRMKKRGELSSKTTPARSNLTATGDMVESIDHKVKKGSLLITVDTKYAEHVHDACADARAAVAAASGPCTSRRCWGRWSRRRDVR